MPRLVNRPPKYRLHKASGQAIVTTESRDHYLGPFGSPESHEAYQCLVAQWTARQKDSTCRVTSSWNDVSDLRICELLVAYMEFARQ